VCGLAGTKVMRTAARTRQKVQRDGVFKTVESWAKKREPTLGFELLTLARQWTLRADFHATALSLMAWIFVKSRVTLSSSNSFSGPVGAKSVKGGSYNKAGSITP
jgi:hypothetical protein